MSVICVVELIRYHKPKQTNRVKQRKTETATTLLLFYVTKFGIRLMFERQQFLRKGNL